MNPNGQDRRQLTDERSKRVVSNLLETRLLSLMRRLIPLITVLILGVFAVVVSRNIPDSFYQSVLLNIGSSIIAITVIFIIVGLTFVPRTSREDTSDDYDNTHTTVKVIDVPREDKSNNLQVRANLPSNISVDEYLELVDNIHSIDRMYSILALVESGNKEALEFFTTSYHENITDAEVSKLLTQALKIAGLDPLRLKNMHYGSPFSFNFEGIDKIIKEIRDTIQQIRWGDKKAKEAAELENQGKALDNETKKVDIQSKGLANQVVAVEIEQKKIDLQKKRVELLSQQLDVFGKFANLPDDQKELFMTMFMDEAKKLADSPLQLLPPASNDDKLLDDSSPTE